MSHKKEAEEIFKGACNKIGWWSKKWTDVRYCPRCRSPIFMTQRDPGDDESIVDYLVERAWSLQSFDNTIACDHVWVECKQGKERFDFADINAKQREFLTNHNDHGAGTYLFLVVGAGRAPKEKRAFLVQWRDWLSVEKNIEVKGKKSINFKDIDDFSTLQENELEWVPKEGFQFNYKMRYQGWIRINYEKNNDKATTTPG